jgi:hypothetical protein
VTHNFSATTINYCTGDDITVTWTAVDDCGNSSTASSTIIVITHDYDATTLDICNGGGTTTVTWTATDACGNSETVSRTITITEDNTAPTLTVPAPLTLDCGDISETSDPSIQILDWLASATATDVCDTDPELTYDFDFTLLNMCAPAPYTITVTWTAVDHCNNDTTKTSTITVIPDTQVPTITVPAPLTLDCGDINETSDPSIQILDWLASATATDNCDTDPELTYDFDFTLLNMCAPAPYTITVTWTAVDACNNDTTKTSTILVIPDTQVPNLTVPGPLTLDCGDINETSDPTIQILDWLASATATDNCDTDPELTYDFDFTLLNMCAPAPYTITVTWSAIDHCNNDTTKTSTITVIPDTQVPNITVPAPLTLDCGDINETSDPTIQILDWLASATATDNCDTDPELTYDFDFTLLNMCAPAPYTITVTWSAIDHCNNDTTKTSTITVIPDTQKPDITVPAPLVLDCGDINETSDPTIQILDWLASATATDNCDTDPELTYDFDFTTLDVCVGGTITVTWTAVDHCNNSSTKTSTITVIPDTFDPEFIQCPTILVYNTDVDVCGANVTWPIPGAEDACTAAVTVEQTGGPVQGSFLEVDTKYTIVYTATDACGNTATCSFMVEVEDTQNPVVECPGNVYVSTDAGVCTAELGEELTQPTYVFDNCEFTVYHSITGATIVPFGPGQVADPQVFNLGASEVTYTLVDDAGNQSSCSFWVNVADTEAPVADACPEDITVENDPDLCGAVVDYVVEFSDNCDTELDLVLEKGFESGAEFPVGTTEVQWIATDEAGNSTVCWFYVTVNDTQDPVIECPENIVVAITVDGLGELISGEAEIISQGPCGITLSYVPPVGTDNCPNPLTLLTSGLGSGPNAYQYGGFYTESYQVVDASGNTAECSFTITIDDSQNPTLTCPNNIVVETDPTICGAAVMYTYPLGVDNCPGWFIIQIEGPGPGEVFPIGTTQVIYQITDFDGNFVQCEFQVRVVDGEAPVIVECAEDEIVLTSANGEGDCCGEVPRLTDDVVVTDNCADTDLGIIALFYDEDYVDTQANCDGEAYNVRQHLIKLGYQVVIIDRIDEFAQWSTALGQTNTLIIPALEGNLNFLSNLPQSVEDLLKSFVNENNGRLLVMAGGSGANEAANVMNVLYNYSLTEDCCYNGNISYLNQPNALYTSFYTGPASIGHHFSTRTINGIPAVNAKAIYEMSTNSDATVARFSKGSGEIVYFGWSFRNGGPLCTDADSDFTRVFNRALLELTGEGIIVTQSPEAYSTICGDHGDEFEVVISTIDYSGNESTCTVTLTLADDENPEVFPPAGLTLDCDDISETTDPSATILDWLASAIATDNCDAEVLLTYDFDMTTLDVCVGGVLTVTWTAVDDAGNIATATSTITVIPDADAPVFVECPTGYTFNNDVDKCGANVTWAVPVAEDACTAAVTVVQTGGPAQGSFLQVGVIYTIEYTATDACGNTAICTFPVEIVDMQNPVAICQDVVVYLNAAGAATIIASDVDGGSYDNCADIDLAINISSFTCAEVGENNVTLTVTDASGNSEVCVAEVTVVDAMPPTFTCPSPALVSGCDELVPDLVILVTDAADNCGVASIVQNPVAGTDFGNQSGQSVIVTITVTDVNGNTTSCEVPVTIDDTVPPVFVNCPTEMIMIGNDPDQCAGKLNWSIPVAEDNCSLASIVQIAGPPVGTSVPVCQLTTITYKATDASGNASFCSFEVLVIDTQKPKLDLDVLMPSNATVQCDAVPAPFVLTNDDVNDNCTASEDLVINYTQVSTQDASPFNCGHYNYTLTRTWTVTDETCIFGGGGNVLTHVQVITVVDTQAPTALCKDLTVTLDKFGQASITGLQINNGSFDNCAPAFVLTYVANPNTFTCANLGANTVTLTVTDPCGNAATCTSTVTVVEGIGPCVPEYAVETECLNNATTLTDGQFSELITVKSLAGQTWTVVSSTGLFAFSSPAPPAAPVPVANGAAFVMGSADGIDNDGDGSVDEAEEMIYYTLKAKFVEGIGYTVTIQSNLGETATISNKAYYPTPVFVDLYDPYCLSTPPFEIQVEDFYGGAGVMTEVLINGVETNIFDAGALGIGQHTIKVTFDAGAQQNFTTINGVVVDGSDAEALADPGCEQMITTFVNVVGTPTTVVCNDTIQVSLQGDCVSEITPDMILEGTYYCYDDYTVTITYPQGSNTYTPPVMVDASHIGKTLTVNLSHPISGNMCWAYIVVEDKWKPTIECPENVAIYCVENEHDLSLTGNPVAFDCSDFTLEYNDEFVQFTCAQNPSVQEIITRTWFVADIHGNTNSCVQTITILRPELSDIVLPEQILEFNCDEIPDSHPNYTGWPQLAGINLIPGTIGGCGLGVSYEDILVEECPSSYYVERTWKITDLCPEAGGLPVSIFHTQFIFIYDLAPTIELIGQAWNYDAVNDWYLISANGNSSNGYDGCVATGPLPLATIDGVCNEVVSISVNTPVGSTTNGGIIPAPGLSIGQHVITYVVEDECGHVTQASFTINVIDNVAPVAICDEITEVNISSDGIATVNAAVFNDGSYDNCCLEYFQVRRMDGDCNGDEDDFGPTVTFCCGDAGQAIMVVFRAFDCWGNYNDCMVSVNVNDKVPPIVISCPQNQTITCDDYLQNYAAGVTLGDSSVLDGFGYAGVLRQLRLHVTPTVTVNIDNCVKGTITRSWQAKDATNPPVTCTQTITVNHVSNFQVTWPADVTSSVRKRPVAGYGRTADFQRHVRADRRIV